MTALHNYRKYQQLILKAKSRPISSNTDFEKIYRIENQFFLKALKEAREKEEEIIARPNLLNGSYYPVKKDFWREVKGSLWPIKFPRINFRSLASFIP